MKTIELAMRHLPMPVPFVSLRVRLFRSLVLTVALPGAIISILMALSIARLARDSEQAQLDILSGQIAARFSDYLHDLQAFSLQTVYGNAVQSYLLDPSNGSADATAAITQLVEAGSRSYSAYLYFFDEIAPDILVNFSDRIDSRYLVTDDEAVANAVSSGQPYGIMMPRLDRQIADKEIAVLTTYRIVHRLSHGEPVGILLLNVPIAAIDAVLSPVVRGREARLSLEDGIGRLLYRVSPGDIGSGDLSRFRRSPDNPTNRRRSVIYSERSIGDTGWTLTLQVPLPSFATGENFMAAAALFLSALIAAFALILIVYIPHYVLKPLHELRGAIARVRSGDFTGETRVTPRDEIGVIFNEFCSMEKDLNALMIRVQEEAERRSRAELAALQSQIGPHFVFNTLNTLKWLAHLQGVPAIEKTTDSLVEILRYAVREDSDVVPLEMELRILERYLQIQNIRYVHAVATKVSITGNIANVVLPRFSLQPIVENVYHHAFPDLDRAGSLEIDVSVDNPDATIEIRDSAGRMPASAVESLLRDRESASSSSEHIGLANVDRRIREAFGPDYGLSIEVCPDIATTVRIRVPARSSGTI